eukprot:750581-Hanusia_phi.AAC.2
MHQWDVADRSARSSLPHHLSLERAHESLAEVENSLYTRADMRADNRVVMVTSQTARGMTIEGD